MRRIIFTAGECEVVTNNRGRFFVPFDDYPELASLYEEAIEIVSRYRTPDQIRTDELTEFAIMADPEGALDIIPDWQEWTEYRVGEHVVYEGTIYRIVQSHRSQHDWLPSEVPALYTVANKTSTDPVDPEDGYPEWEQPTGVHNAYHTGDKVMFEGLAYQSVIDNNLWSPVDHPEGWVEIDLPEDPEEPEEPEDPEDPEEPEEPEDPEEPGYPEWAPPTGSHDAYNTGDRVIFEGKVYESLMDGNTWSPTDNPAGWGEIEVEA